MARVLVFFRAPFAHGKSVVEDRFIGKWTKKTNIVLFLLVHLMDPFFISVGRIEEHLLTTNLVFDKTLLLDVPVWIVSLDLSKAFDKVKW